MYEKHEWSKMTIAGLKRQIEDDNKFEVDLINQLKEKKEYYQRQ